MPAELPVFPLTGVLLLPGGKLPLNIFEPRYLAMVERALAGNRLIGMVQPAVANPDDNIGLEAQVDDDQPYAEQTLAAQPPKLYRTGCAGRVVQFEEAEDGRYLILLKGVCRFRIGRELPPAEGGFRLVEPEWQPFADDLQCKAAEPGEVVNRDRLIPSLQQYFELHGLAADWEVIACTPDDRLVTTLAMICPFAPQEKQALLEAGDLAARVEVMQTLIEMAVHEGGDAAPIRH